MIHILQTLLVGHCSNLKDIKRQRVSPISSKTLLGDPIVNDHFGDVLWKNGSKIQARYYWKYVLGLEKTEDKLRVSVKE